MVVLFVLFTIISFLTIDYFVQRAEQRRAIAVTPAHVVERRASRRRGKRARVFDDPARLPGGVFVAPGHVWMRVEPSGSVVLGVDRLLLSFLGDVDCLYALPEGSPIREGGPLMMLRRGNRGLKIRSPISGAISEVNQPTRRSPGRIATDPFGRGWIYRVSPTGLADSLKKTVVAEQASRWMRGELTRFRDTLQRAVGGDAVGLALADGGVPADGLEGLVGAREWEQLVASFFGEADSETNPGSLESAELEVDR